MQEKYQKILAVPRAATPADWQLPPGVDRPLWDALHDADRAATYDDHLADTPLLQLDRAFVEEHCPRPGTLIDLGCGTGRLLIPLAQRGYWVLGVDLSAAMLRIAGAKARAAGVAVHRLQANLVQLDCLADATFDYAVCLFSTLGMVRGAGNRRAVVDHVYRVLRPGGVFVLHVHNRWFNGWDRAGRRWLVHDLARQVLGHAESGDRVAPGTGLALHHFTRREVVGLLRSAGFQLRAVCPVGRSTKEHLPAAGWWTWLWAYGYLIAAVRL